MKPADLRFRKAVRLGYRFLWGAVDWVYPPVCAGCGEFGSNWCKSCQGNVRKLVGPVCRVCGDPLRRPGLCRDCAAERPLFHSARSWAMFDGPLQNALHCLKYRNDIGLGQVLSAHLAEMKIPASREIDLIVPVPLSRSRLRERGYNQAAMLAFPLSLRLLKPYSSRALRKVVETKTQVGLKIAERIINMKNAFQADPTSVAGKTILLIDDVMTTGSTLNDCSRALLEAGAFEVNALTLARTKFNDNIS